MIDFAAPAFTSVVLIALACAINFEYREDALYVRTILVLLAVAQVGVLLSHMIG